jgi:hypothetical protein
LAIKGGEIPLKDIKLTKPLEIVIESQETKEKVTNIEVSGQLGRTKDGLNLGVGPKFQLGSKITNQRTLEKYLIRSKGSKTKPRWEFESEDNYLDGALGGEAVDLGLLHIKDKSFSLVGEFVIESPKHISLPESDQWFLGMHRNEVTLIKTYAAKRVMTMLNPHLSRVEISYE